MAELRGDNLAVDLWVHARSVSLGENATAEDDDDAEAPADNVCSTPPRLYPVTTELPGELAEYVRDRLPWRSLEDGGPVSMDVATAGVLVASERNIRPAGTPYVVVSVDSWDAADAVHASLFDIAGLDEAEWTAGWMLSSGSGFREIMIFPPIDLAA